MRLGPQDGFVYSVVDMMAVPPYTIRLNRPFQGTSSPNATLWRQDRKGEVRAAHS